MGKLPRVRRILTFLFIVAAGLPLFASAQVTKPYVPMTDAEALSRFSALEVMTFRQQVQDILAQQRDVIEAANRTEALSQFDRRMKLLDGVSEADWARLMASGVELTTLQRETERLHRWVAPMRAEASAQAGGEVLSVASDSVSFPNANYSSRCGSVRNTPEAMFDAAVVLEGARGVHAALSRACDEVIAGFNGSLACIVADVVLAAAEGVFNTLQFCDNDIDSSEIEGSYQRLGHLHSDVDSAQTAIINNDNSNKTAIVNNDNSNKTAIVDHTSSIKNDIVSNSDSNKTAIVNNDNANKTAIVNNDNANKTAIVDNDNANKTAIVANDNANKAAIVANDNTNKDTIVGNDNTNKSAVVINDDANRDIILDHLQANVTTITGAVDANTTTIVNNDNANKAAIVANDEANESAILANSDANRNAILSNDDANRNTIVSNDNSNRSTIVSNDNSNRDAIIAALIANADANRDLLIAELRALGCEVVRLLNTPEGQRSSEIVSCAAQPAFPYAFPEKKLTGAAASGIGLDLPRPAAPAPRRERPVAMETDLAAGRLLPSYYLPAARGGLLESVRDLVWTTIGAQAELEIAPVETETARAEALKADEILAAGRYVDAYRQYAAAYQQLIPKP